MRWRKISSFKLRLRTGIMQLTYLSLEKKKTNIFVSLSMSRISAALICENLSQNICDDLPCLNFGSVPIDIINCGKVTQKKKYCRVIPLLFLAYTFINRIVQHLVDSSF